MDSSNILSLNQQYATATGAVLALQNAGSGAAIALTQTGSSTVDVQLATGTVQSADGTTSTAVKLQSGTASAGASGVVHCSQAAVLLAQVQLPFSLEMPRLERRGM